MPNRVGTRIGDIIGKRIVSVKQKRSRNTGGVYVFYVDYIELDDGSRLTFQGFDVDGERFGVAKMTICPAPGTDEKANDDNKGEAK